MIADLALAGTSYFRLFHQWAGIPVNVNCPQSNIRVKINFFDKMKYCNRITVNLADKFFIGQFRIFLLYLAY